MKAKFVVKSQELEITYRSETEDGDYVDLEDWLSEAYNMDFRRNNDVGNGLTKTVFGSYLGDSFDPLQDDLLEFANSGLRPGLVFDGKKWRASVDTRYPKLTVIGKNPEVLVGAAVTKWGKAGFPIDGVKVIDATKAKIKELKGK